MGSNQLVCAAIIKVIKNLACRKIQLFYEVSRWINRNPLTPYRRK